MTVLCSNCSLWKLKESPLRQHGLGLCKVYSGRSQAKTFGGFFPRTCPKFQQAEPEVIAARTRALNPKQETAT
jgi:hypothetical protein